MSNLTEIQSRISKHKDNLSRKYKLKKIAIFGSYTRGDEGQKSDVDILVEFNEPIGLEFVSLAEELESILNEKVDLVSK
ncbi:MAG: nucleotidyltransferase family protein, partial [Ignavibacteria bacterium]